MSILSALLWAGVANADEPRVHVTGGAAHAIGGTQEHEFGAGGGGSATVELPVGNVFGFQASGGAIVLSSDQAPTDTTVAKQSTGSAFTGTVGVRFRPLGGMMVAGPWIDANGGIAQTGGESRVALDAHLGWDFRVSRKGRWDVGPFVGFTQIMQSDVTFRPDDAHVLWAGLQVSLGATERRPAAPPVLPERAPAPYPEFDGVAQADDYCPIIDDASEEVPAGCPTPQVTLVDDRIVLDDVIHFEFGSPRIRSRSFGLVRNVARLLTQHPEILEVSIEGHADARGTDDFNMRLSEARAASTRAMLVHFGVQEQRLRVVGYGKSKLLVPTALPEIRNRRVEFIVTGTVGGRSTVGMPSPSSGNRGEP